jgi:hypothetical protein
MASPLIYPVELRGTNRPMMRMKCVKPNIKFKSPKPIEIYVPIPVGVTFNDGASYNESELGIIGGAVMNATRNISGGMANAGFKGAVAAGVKSGTDAFNSVSTKDIIAGIVGNAPIDGEVKSGVAIGMGTTLNKNVTTEFTGVGVRSFSFAFKFVSKNEEETLVIKDIIESFRSNLYPIGNFISLQYPPTWNIQFLNGVSGKDIPYLPKIFECYLKGLSSNFNPSANVWRQGGSPIETDVTVEFIESRALTYDDIKSLEARAFQEGDFARMYGGGGVESGSKDTINSSATTPTNSFTIDKTNFPADSPAQLLNEFRPNQLNQSTGANTGGKWQNPYGIGGG